MQVAACRKCHIKTVCPSFVQKGVEFDTFKSGVVQHLPSAEKLKVSAHSHIKQNRA